MRVSLAGLVALSAVLSCSAFAAAEEICGLEFDDPGTLWQEMQSDPRFKAVQGTELYLAFVDGLDRLRSWSITTPANPAHPAIICRSLVQQQDAWVVITRVSCGGPKPACDSMVADFEELDNTMADYIKQKNLDDPKE